MSDLLDIKKLLLSILILIFWFPLFLLIWSQSYNLINSIDPGIYIRFATDNKYNVDKFFNEEIDEKTNIYSVIYNALKDTKFENVANKQSLYNYLWKEKKLVTTIITENKEYTKYLKENNLTINDFWMYIEKMTTLDETLLNGSFYISTLIEILIFYFIFKYRLRIYLVAFFIYTFFNLNAFTFDIFGNLLFPFLRSYYSFIGNSLNYEDYQKMIKISLPTIKEALLTYIIIDVI
ncbi:hypothetical protein, partial [Paenibacillus nuruki]|uniref:hypothetical protein n=1 Tax=Paenibacillus nuruki TaxID=1886670 RepID=UPI001112E7D6